MRLGWLLSLAEPLGFGWDNVAPTEDLIAAPGFITIILALLSVGGDALCLFFFPLGKVVLIQFESCQQKGHLFCKPR